MKTSLGRSEDMLCDGRRTMYWRSNLAMHCSHPSHQQDCKKINPYPVSAMSSQSSKRERHVQTIFTTTGAPTHLNHKVLK